MEQMKKFFQVMGVMASVIVLVAIIILVWEAVEEEVASDTLSAISVAETERAKFDFQLPTHTAPAVVASGAIGAPIIQPDGFQDYCDQYRNYPITILRIVTMNALPDGTVRDMTIAGGFSGSDRGAEDEKAAYCEIRRMLIHQLENRAEEERFTMSPDEAAWSAPGSVPSFGFRLQNGDWAVSAGMCSEGLKGVLWRDALDICLLAFIAGEVNSGATSYGDKMVRTHSAGHGTMLNTDILRHLGVRFTVERHRYCRDLRTGRKVKVEESERSCGALAQVPRNAVMQTAVHIHNPNVEGAVPPADWSLDQLREMYLAINPSHEGVSESAFDRCFIEVAESPEMLQLARSNNARIEDYGKYAEDSEDAVLWTLLTGFVDQQGEVYEYVLNLKVQQCLAR